jgi:hypothetical protein
MLRADDYRFRYLYYISSLHQYLLTHIYCVVLAGGNDGCLSGGLAYIYHTIILLSYYYLLSAIYYYLVWHSLYARPMPRLRSIVSYDTSTVADEYIMNPFWFLVFGLLISPSPPPYTKYDYFSPWRRLLACCWLAANHIFCWFLALTQSTCRSTTTPNHYFSVTMFLCLYLYYYLLLSATNKYPLYY